MYHVKFSTITSSTERTRSSQCSDNEKKRRRQTNQRGDGDAQRLTKAIGRDTENC